MDLDRMAPDRSIVTGSVQATDDPVAQDEAAIKLAVAEWPAAAPPPELMPWVNIRTGSSGALQIVSDVATGNTGSCRQFTATREAFDGVGRYNGRACVGQAGGWQVTVLDKD